MRLTLLLAGIAVTLAGDAGKKLESFFNTELAAMMIYEASGYKIHPARFIDDKESALADMKRLAEAQWLYSQQGAGSGPIA